MTRPYGPGDDRNEPRPEDRDPRERAVAPPIEREHETWAGVIEEDEKRERESERR